GDHAEGLLEETRHGPVRFERIVNHRLGGHFGPAARRRGGAFGAAREPPEQLLTVVLGERAQVEIVAGGLGGDVLLIAAPASAGVPITWMRPANGTVPSATASAAPAPAPAVAITLWPQAWPIDGSASYSAMIAMVGPEPEPSIVARNAVGRPPTPRSTRAPCFSRNSVSQPCAFSSWKQSSGVSWILCDSASRSSAIRSTAAATLCLAALGALTSFS